MARIFLSCYLLATVVTAEFQNTKVSLEDIERDYLTSERPPSQYQTKGTNSVQSPSKFGFVPTRTAASYARNQPKTSFTQANYRPPKNFGSPSFNTHQYTQQHSRVPPQTYVVPEYSQPDPQTLQYSPQPQSQKYVTQQQYFGEPQGQKYTTNQQYSFEAQPQSFARQQQYTSVTHKDQQPTYDQYDNVQYVNDNSIAQQTTQPQQYYNAPQYYYVQQYQAPSTAVQTVVDPKGLQYVTYVPSYSPNSIPTELLNYEGATNPADADVSVPPSSANLPSSTRYQELPGPPKYQELSSPPEYQTKQIEYHPRKSPAKYTKSEYVARREPKSLLESYVPSYLQLRYLEQQRKNLNRS